MNSLNYKMTEYTGATNIGTNSITNMTINIRDLHDPYYNIPFIKDLV